VRDELKHEYPVCYALEGAGKALDKDDAADATAADRIRSIWPFIVQRVLRFQSRLNDRERANFDTEDCLLEVWCELASRDDKYDATRGRYITFAAPVIDHCLYAVRERARTIESPRNSTCRMEGYKRQAAEGVLSDRCRRTSEAIQRTVRGPDTTASMDREIEDDPLDAAMAVELNGLSADLIIELVAALEPYEAAVLGARFGLWGQPTRTLSELASELSCDRERLGRARRSGWAKIVAQARDLGRFLSDD
jgi:hypothetical protein